MEGVNNVVTISRELTEGVRKRLIVEGKEVETGNDVSNPIVGTSGEVPHVGESLLKIVWEHELEGGLDHGEDGEEEIGDLSNHLLVSIHGALELAGFLDGVITGSLLFNL